jgi:hypothetical protein
MNGLDRRLLISRLVLSLVFANLIGCGGGLKRIPVTGSVTVGGKPAVGANVLFHPEDPTAMTASGVVGEDGAYSLVSGMEPGLVPGKYKVTVIWPDPSKKPTQAQIMMGTAEPGPDLLKGKYASKASTSLVADVTESTSTIPAFAL